MTDTVRNPKLSIVVPNYNSGSYITDFIESVIGQEFKDWEMLMVDDSSTDGSDMIIAQYADRDSRIHMLKRPDSDKAGACQRRNQGLKEASGEFIVFFDSDDVIPPGSLGERVKALEAHPELDFVVSPAISFMKEPFDLKQLVLGIPIFDNDLEMFISRYRLPFGVWNNTYRHQFFSKSGMKWDNELSSLQDSDLNIRSIESGARYAYVLSDKPTYFWRIGGNPNSITKLIARKDNLRSQIYFFNKLSNSYSGSPYENALQAFALTLLLRCAVCGETDIPDTVIRKKSWRWRFRLLTQLYRNPFIRKFTPLLNLILFPLSIGRQYLFVINNRLECRRRISQMCSSNR